MGNFSGLCLSWRLGKNSEVVPGNLKFIIIGGNGGPDARAGAREARMKDAKLWYGGGIAGVLSVGAYFAAIFFPWPETQLGTSAAVAAVSAFPILGIVSVYALGSFIAAEREGAANRIAFPFAVAGFSTLLAMLLVQVAVNSGMAEMARGLDATTAKALKRSLRLVDMGLDVAWDLLFGTAMLFWGFALRKRSGFGPGWGWPLLALGGLLMALNLATFPWPPNSRGSVDLGPLAGAFMLALFIRLAFLGRRARTAAAPAGEGSS